MFSEAICCTELKILLPHPFEWWYYLSRLQLETVALGLEAVCGIQESQQWASAQSMLLLSGVMQGVRLTLKATGAMSVWKSREQALRGTEGRQAGELGLHIPILALGLGGSGEAVGAMIRGNELL